ncbi:MAG: apolipoprotein N-acyltransferase, partial [Propionibacteriales bacterium]|nr:apolipoprotein N-acyltransferase [Propionibacteriales bacterium]
TNGPGPDERQTTGMWWDPQLGVTAPYKKRNLVPFGEWIPFREQLLPLIPMLQLVGRQGVPGTEPGVINVVLPDGRPLAVGDLICFELAYDNTVNDVITNGAQVVLVQSNNATYGGTGQIEQQFAITRARAMETRREISVATTNSVSGHIDRRGRVTERTQEFTAASSVVTMPVREGRTPAVIVGRWVDRAASLAGLGAVLLAIANSWSGRSRRRGAWTVGPMREPTSSAPVGKE